MHYMNNIFSNVRGFYHGINSTPNCGAVDIIVVEQPDGTFKSTPMRIVFGMLGVIKPRHQSIDVRVNNVPIRLNLKLGEFGDVYLAEEDSKCELVRSLSTGTLDSLLVHESEISTNGIRRHSSSESNCTMSGDQFPTQKEEPVLVEEPRKEEFEAFLDRLNEDTNSDNSESLFPDIKMSLCGDVLNTEDPLSRFNSCLVSQEEFAKSPSSVLSNKRLVFLYDGRFYTWHSIGPLLISLSVFGVPLPHDTMDSLNCYPPKSRRRQALNWIFGSRRYPKEMESSSDLNLSDFEFPSVTSDSEIDSPRRVSRPFNRPSVLSSEQILEMNLKPGANEASFSVTTSFQGTCTVTCRIFLWSYSDKLVVSDIDGTITKTDVLGHVLPLVGMNWCHDHVVEMCRAISDNGYRLIYLSARSIAQSAVTSQFIHKVRQEGLSLPEGPIMLSPYGLIQALNREIILKCPQEFKIRCLQEIIDLFPVSKPMPIIGGFGNRETDLTTYRSVGLSSSRIFIVDPKSRVVIPNMVKLNTSYMNVNECVDAFFPFHDGQKDEMDGDYASCNYWKFPFEKIK